jgi:hypothetical protein
MQDAARDGQIARSLMLPEVNLILLSTKERKSLRTFDGTWGAK